MNGMFENGPIPPEALGGDDDSGPRFQFAGPTSQSVMRADGWGFDWMDGELVGICAPDGRRFVPEDWEAKAQAFREDMIERVTRKGPEGGSMTTHPDIPTDELEWLAEQITEGPWAAFSERPLNACAEVRKGHTNIATCYGGDDPCDSPAKGEPWPNQPRRDANARLIAIAPALLRELISRRKADEWQPISTAPRDGTWFIGCIDMFGSSSYRIVHFADAYDRYPINAESKCWSRAPTHWRPLPTPPSTLTAGDSHDD